MLVHVPERRVRPIRHRLFLLNTDTNLSPIDGFYLGNPHRLCLSVAPSVKQPQEDGHEHGASAYTKHGNLGRKILRRILLAERLRPDNVGNGKANSDGGICCHLLGVALGVGTHEGVDESQRGHVKVDEIDARKSSRLGVRVERHEARPNESRHQEQNDGQPAGEVVQNGKRPRERGGDGYDARRHVEEGRRLGLIPEPGNQRRREGGNDARGNDDENRIEAEQPYLQVSRRFKYVAGPEYLLSIARLIPRKGFFDEQFFTVAEEFGLVNTLRHSKRHSRAHGQVKRADRNKHDAPTFKRRSGRAVLRGPRHQAAQGLTNPQAAVPYPRAWSSLPPRIPLGRDHDESRGDDGLEHAEERADGRHAGKALRGGGAADGHAPEKNVDAENLGHREALDEVALGELSHGIADKEGCCHPREVVAVLELETLGDAHDVGIVDEHLVKKLEEVAEEHERHDGPVDLADGTPKPLARGVLDHRLARSLAAGRLLIQRLAIHGHAVVLSGCRGCSEWSNLVGCQDEEESVAVAAFDQGHLSQVPPTMAKLALARSPKTNTVDEGSRRRYIQNCLAQTSSLQQG